MRCVIFISMQLFENKIWIGLKISSDLYIYIYKSILPSILEGYFRFTVFRDRKLVRSKKSFSQLERNG